MRGKYLLVVGPLTPSVIRAVESILRDKLWGTLELVVLARDTDYTNRIVEKYNPTFKTRVINCSFDSHAELSRIVEPFKDQTVGVVCRSDKHVQDLRKVVPLLPASVYVASQEALTTATNKRLMREAFLKFAPSITPRFIKAKDYTNKTIMEIEKWLDYPVIVKPTNLASSLLIQACQTRSELEKALNKIFNLISNIYETEQRQDPPEVIVEEYLEGDFYSIDAYILDSNEIYTCPPVLYIPAKQLGIDDFFLFKRSLPAKLKKSEIEAASEVTKQAVKAVGLRYSTAHVELVLTKNGWRIIELGPRLGRFRDRMYRLSYGIDHSLNDVKLHLGLKPEVSDKVLAYCAAYSIYPHHEGKLVAIHGLNKIENNPSLKWHKVFAENGKQVKFAKHGGHSLAELVIACPDPEEFTSLTSIIEKQVYAEID